MCSSLFRRPNSHCFVGYREYSPLHAKPIFAKPGYSCFWLLVPCLHNSAIAECTTGSATLKISDAIECAVKIFEV